MNGKKSYEGEIGKEVALFKNNTYMYPEFYILQTAKLLTEIRTSLKCNVINSRIAPLGKAKNDAEKTELETAFQRIYKGEPYVIKAKKEVFADNKPDPLTENLTQGSDSAYLPYLSQLEDDVLQKFYYHYGININNVNKRAQVTSEELQGADPLCWTIPLMKLKELEKGVEMLRAKYPEAKVDFGGVWKLEFEKYKKAMTAENNNESEEKPNENNENSSTNGNSGSVISE